MQTVFNFWKPFMKTGLMHLLATNLSLWANVVCTEAAEAFAHVFGHSSDDTHGSSNMEHGQNLTTTHVMSTAAYVDENTGK